MYEILKSLVLKNLSLFLFDDAHFYAERLYYQDPTPESLNLLAQCFTLQGKYKQAYLILRECTDSSNKYMFASVCVQLKKFSEAEKCLLADINVSDPKHLTDDDIQAIPGGAAGLYMLGLVCRKQHRKEVAISYFELSLRVSKYVYVCVIAITYLSIYRV